MPSGIERVREIRRLRSRRKKTAKLIARVKAGSMDKTEAIRKLRKLTPGGATLDEFTVFHQLVQVATGDSFSQRQL